MLTLRLSVCALVLGLAAAGEYDSAVPQLASFARQLSESPELGQTVEKALSRALGVPQPRLAGLGNAVQGFLGSISLGSLQSVQASLAAMMPAVAVAALVISILALVKVSMLFKSSGYSHDTFFDTLGLGLFDHHGIKADVHGYKGGYSSDDGYSGGYSGVGGYSGGYSGEGGYGGRYEPTEYVHYAPEPEYGHGHLGGSSILGSSLYDSSIHGDSGLHGAGPIYHDSFPHAHARSLSKDAHQEDQHGSPAEVHSDSSEHEATTGKAGRVLFS